MRELLLQLMKAASDEYAQRIGLVCSGNALTAEELKDLASFTDMYQPDHDGTVTVFDRAARGALPHRAPSPRCAADPVHHVWHRSSTC